MHADKSRSLQHFADYLRYLRCNVSRGVSPRFNPHSATTKLPPSPLYTHSATERGNRKSLGYLLLRKGMGQKLNWKNRYMASDWQKSLHALTFYFIKTHRDNSPPHSQLFLEATQSLRVKNIKTLGKYS